MKTFLERIRQKHRTVAYPDEPPALPNRYRGRPMIGAAACVAGCRACVDACPTDAVSKNDRVHIDLGRCLFCGECADACTDGLISFTRDHRMAARVRAGLHVDSETYRLAEALDAKSRRIFGRSLKLRQVSAGGCNACESDLNVLSTVVYDLGRFGIQFVASPRHADGTVVTGPVTENMALALKKTYDAMPAPKFVIAVGCCAISGGLYRGFDACRGGVDSMLPVDLYVPGCPPHPATILDGILRLLGRIHDEDSLTSETAR